MSESTLAPLSVVKAGAGAGKTYRIQQQLTDWIRHGTIRADRILAVTFTHAAANELRERIRLALLKDGLVEAANLVQQSTINTIHGFGFEILGSFAYEQGLSPTPRQLTEAEENQLIRQALHHVEAITSILDALPAYGYTGGYAKNAYQDGATQLKNRILQVIHKLRLLGQGLDEDPNTTAQLLQQAQSELTTAYGPTRGADTLNQALWQAILAVRQHFPDQATLEGEWASNDATRQFVRAIYEASAEQLTHDWTLWTALQTIATAPKISNPNKETEHPQASLARAVWDQADQLCHHPGPLEQALKHIDSLLNSAIEALQQYQQLKSEAGLVDFGDMVHLAERILANPKWLQEAASRYDCLIIDEFQDTNPLQFALLHHFQRVGLPTLIVGDIKQSIMGFQGADSRLFASLMKGTDDNHLSELPDNWRSTPELMAFINQIGATLYGTNYRPLTPQAQYASSLPAIQWLTFDKQHWGKKRSKHKQGINSEGPQAMARHIAQLLRDPPPVTDRHTNARRPLRPADIAVLGRTHDRLYHFAAALRAWGIQVRVSEPGFLASPVVQWVLNALQYLNNPNDQAALLDLLTAPLFNQDHSERLNRLLSDYLEQGHFTDPFIDQLQQIDAQLHLLPVKDQIITLTEGIGLLDHLLQRHDGEQLRANLIKLIGLADEFQQIQSESLRAMGIHGRNAVTFQTWLGESASEIDDQPASEIEAANAVELCTWHAAKGREWPVVLILDTHQFKGASTPEVDINYPSDSLEAMLAHAYVRILPKFTDKTTQARFENLLADSAIENQKNLCYVALTRAREQLILPWFDDFDDHSLLFYLQLMLEQSHHADPGYRRESNALLSDDATLPDNIVALEERRCIKADVIEAVSPLPHTITPSLDSDDTIDDTLAETRQSYGNALDLAIHDREHPANVIGTAIHQYYHVYLLRPEQMEQALALPPVLFDDPEQQRQLMDHLEAFQSQLAQAPIKATHWQCELPILTQNAAGQTISGSIDLLVESEQGYWIVDHKTDRQIQPQKHLHQLRHYADNLTLDKPIIGLGMNWIRHGVLTLHTFPKT